MNHNCTKLAGAQPAVQVDGPRYAALRRDKLQRLMGKLFGKVMRY